MIGLTMTHGVLCTRPLASFRARCRFRRHEKTGRLACPLGEIKRVVQDGAERDQDG
jgi:hypothetical protein